MLHLPNRTNQDDLKRIYLSILYFNTVNQREIITQSSCREEMEKKSEKESGELSSIQLVHPLYTSMSQLLVDLRMVKDSWLGIWASLLARTGSNLNVVLLNVEMEQV